MSQKTFVEKQTKIGDITVIKDWSMGKYGISVVANGENNKWDIEPYDFDDEVTASVVFELVVDIITKFVSDEPIVTYNTFTERSE